MNSYKKNYSLLLVFFLVQFLFSQVQRYHHYPIQNFTPRQYGSLQSPQNLCITQSKEGLIYVGNANGVLEYDGVTWNFIPVMNGQYVYSLATDENNLLYAGGYGNFGLFQREKNGKLIYLSLSDSLLKEEDKFFTQVWKIFAGDGLVYFQTQEAIYIYDGKKIETILPKESFHLSMMVKNELYVREKGVGLIKISRGVKKLLNGSDITSSYGIFGLLEDDEEKNHLLLITQEKGLFWLNNDGKLEEIQTQDKQYLIDSKILGGIKISNNRFALNSEINGTLIINNKGNLLSVINSETGLQNNFVHAQVVDRIGNLWQCLNKGISKTAIQSPLQFFSESSGLTGNIYDAVYVEGVFYVGSSDGLFLKENNSSNFSVLPEIRCVVKNLCSDNGQLIAATDNGLFHITGEKTKRVMSGQFNFTFYSSTYEKWIAITANSVIVLDKNLNMEYSIPDLQGELYTVSEGKTDKDEKPYIWISTTSGNAFVLDLSEKVVRVNSFSSVNGLPGDWIYAFQHEGKILFGSNYGLLKLNGKSFDTLGVFEEAKMFDIKNNESFSFYHRNMNNFYFVTENKIHLQKSDAKKIIELPFLPIDLGKINSIARGNKQALFACNDGLAIYSEQDSFPYQIEYNVLLRKLKLEGDSLLFEGSRLNNFKLGTDLSYSLNSLEIEVCSDFFYQEEKMEYQAVLSGADSTISSWQKSNRFKFSNLSEGNYTITIYARNIFGKTSKPFAAEFGIQAPWYRTKAAYTIYGIGFLLLLFTTSKISSHRVQKRNRELEKIVEERTAEIAGKNRELETRNLEILHQKEEITDSINYAKRIQNAILPPIEEIQAKMKDIFILYLPKDIVSGDFYWYHKLNEHEFLIACADCTGHGVPGGFMSMVCADKLNEAVNHHQHPSKILEHANKSLKKSLRQDGSSQSSKDGMEISLLRVNTQSKSIVYAGANRFLWIVRSDTKELEDIKPTKAGIGGTTDIQQLFQSHEFILKENDCVYLSSDGYGDQFGGEKHKKITTKRFKEILLNNSHKNISEQSQQLKLFFDHWKGNLEQIDDILVIGLKF